MIKRIQESWGIIGVFAAIFIAGGAWALDYSKVREEVAANSQDRRIREFERLSFILSNTNKPDRVTIIKFCGLAAKFGISNAQTKRYCGR